MSWTATALRRALDRIVGRHEVLRTTFRRRGASRSSALLRQTPALPSLSTICAENPTAEVELKRLSEEEATAPFDLARGPLIRGRLVQEADEEHVLLITMHHIVSDGWSMGVLHATN